MKNSVKMIAVLLVLGFLSGGALSQMQLYASPKIAEHKAEAIKQSVYSIFPESDHYETEVIAEREIYKIFNKRERILGYAFIAVGKGYQDDIVMMVGLNRSLDKIEGMEVLQSLETPGLGGKIMETGFKSQFKGLATSSDIIYINSVPKTDGEIQAITGATISTRSVVRILNDAIKDVKSKINI